MNSKKTLDLVKVAFGSVVGYVICFTLGILFVGLAIRIALSFPGDSMVPLLFVGIALAVWFGLSVYNSIKEE